MSSWAAEIRKQEAAHRREERESRHRQKKLERLIKEQTKLSELERARLEVEVHQNAIEELLSVHKEQGERIDWPKLASAPPGHTPFQAGRHEFAAVLAREIAPWPAMVPNNNATVEESHSNDEEAHRRALTDHQIRVAEQERLRILAQRVLVGESQAYYDTIEEFAPFSEITLLGSSLRLTLHGPKLIGCVLTVHGQKVIPTEVKSLSAAGKLSVKAMPKGRFHEIYQDHVCSCALRVARVVLALLPADIVLVTASVDAPDNRTGNWVGLPVLSIAFDRAGVERLDFEHLDPSDAMENFMHRGDAKTSRKSGDFVPIVPLDPVDVMPVQPERQDLSKLITRVRHLRAEIAARMIPQARTTEPISKEPLQGV